MRIQLNYLVLKRMRVLVQNVRVHIAHIQVFAHYTFVKFVENEQWQGVDLGFACKCGVLALQNGLVAELFCEDRFNENIYIENKSKILLA